jgi:hypothetical protein
MAAKNPRKYPLKKNTAAAFALMVLEWLSLMFLQRPMALMVTGGLTIEGANRATRTMT